MCPKIGKCVLIESVGWIFSGDHASTSALSEQNIVQNIRVLNLGDPSYEILKEVKHKFPKAFLIRKLGGNYWIQILPYGPRAHIGDKPGYGLVLTYSASDSNVVPINGLSVIQVSNQLLKPSVTTED
jgi:hypothetical protein